MTTLLFKIVKEDAVSPKQINPSLGWPVDVVLKRAMAKNPAERYATCADFAQAFTNACNSSKGWHPLPPGGSHNMPTMFERPAAAASIAAASHSEKSAVTPPPAAVPDVKSDPKPLRILRTLAVVILAAGFVSLAMVGAFNYFSSNFNDAPAARQVDPPPPVAVSPKPSPTQSPTLPDAKPAEPVPEQTEPKGEVPQEAPRQPRAAKEPEPAEYPARLVSNPPGAIVTIDSKPDVTCKTPCSINLGPGRHTLSTNLAGFRRALRIFELPKEPEVFMNLEPTTGTVMIRSDPPGFAILVDGQPRSEKTPALITLPTGSHKIEVAREGFRNYAEVLEIKDSVITNIEVNWGSK
jgi:hypothetical protein